MGPIEALFQKNLSALKQFVEREGHARPSQTYRSRRRKFNLGIGWYPSKDYKEVLFQLRESLCWSIRVGMDRLKSLSEEFGVKAIR